jgi:hypothetical protein
MSFSGIEGRARVARRPAVSPWSARAAQCPSWQVRRKTGSCEETHVFKGPQAQRLAAVFCGGWVALSFPLLGLWDHDITVFGLPLWPTALFALWAVLIGLIAVIGQFDQGAERGDD